MYVCVAYCDYDEQSEAVNCVVAVVRKVYLWDVLARRLKVKWKVDGLG